MSASFQAFTWELRIPTGKTSAQAMQRPWPVCCMCSLVRPCPFLVCQPCPSSLFLFARVLCDQQHIHHERHHHHAEHHHQTANCPLDLPVRPAHTTAQTSEQGRTGEETEERRGRESRRGRNRRRN